MCGICGIIDFSGRTTNKAQQETLTRRMLKRMHHRGPDHHDVISDTVATLGVARLSILDRSVAGNQPMKSPTGRYIQAFNGEIYNYRAIRQSLESKGKRFTSNSDTEVLLRLFEARGEACLDELRGMFAFAVWDRSTRSLFIARDRAGEKPLVYSYHDGCFSFASEISALLELPWVSRNPNWEGIHYGLHYVHIPAPYSAFTDVSKLPPATSLVVDDKGLQFKKYWQLRFESRYGPEDKQKCCRDICDELDATTKLMSQSDVPVGTFLSGGLDSSTVTASLARELKDLPAFRIGHPGPENERENTAAISVTSRYKANLHNYPISCNSLDSLREFVAMHAEPTGTMVALDYYRLAREASKYVTVVLGGNGADEMFGGYDLSVMESLDKSRAHWAIMRELMPENNIIPASSGMTDFVTQMREIDNIGPHLFYANNYLQRGRRFTAEIYTRKMADLIAQQDSARLLVDQYHDANNQLLFNTTTYQMLNLTCQYSLVDHADTCGMASSIEVRSPFLDVRMMELAASIPPAWKVGHRGGHAFGKMILREAMAGRLSEDVRYGIKMGFGGTVPYGEWLRNKWNNLFERDALAATGLFDVQKIDRLVQDDLSKDSSLTHMFFNILTLSIWCSLYQ